jgi:ribosomal protein S1
MTSDQKMSPKESTDNRSSRNYWLSRTPAERFAEVERLRIEKYGGEAVRCRIKRVVSIGRLGESESEDHP